MSEWQPIETAPDNVYVLVWLSGFNRVARAWYCTATSLWYEDGEVWDANIPTHWIYPPEPPKGNNK